MSYNNTVPSQVQSRCMVIARHKGTNQHVPVTSRLWEPLAYPLFFPLATLGWGLTSPENDVLSDDCTSITMQMWYYRALLLREDRFKIFGRLMCEYLVNMFTRDLECRLTYIHRNQHRI